MVNNIVIENARIINRNFSGKVGEFNKDGKRSFCLVLDGLDIDRLIAEGWNVKFTKPRDPDEDPIPFINVKMSFNRYPPIVKQITSRNQVDLTEETIGCLDSAEIENVDVIVRPYTYEEGHISAYLKALYVTIYEDEFARKYAAMPSFHG